MQTKAEIKSIFGNYKVKINDTFSNDIEFKWVLNNIESHISSEMPDAYLKKENIVYAIEHFQVSQYISEKNQDVSRIAKGSQKKREKMKEDRDFKLSPSINNLVAALERNLRSHAKSFSSYKTNILNLSDCNNREYKLILFVEDSTESAYIVKRRYTEAINPLRLRQLVEPILQYKKDVWGIIYSYGNEVDKLLTGCTLMELENIISKDQLLDANDYVPFEVEKDLHISSTDESQDSNIVTIKLFDHL